MGKSNKKSKTRHTAQRSLNYAQEGETIYGQVEDAKGSGRFTVICSDTVTRTCTIRGSMQRSVWIKPGDIVLISFIEGLHDKGIIVQKYYDHEVSDLRKKGEIPNTFEATDATESVGIEFDWTKI